MCIIKKILKSKEEKYFSYFFVAVGFFVVFYISQFCQSIFFQFFIYSKRMHCKEWKITGLSKPGHQCELHCNRK